MLDGSEELQAPELLGVALGMGALDFSRFLGCVAVSQKFSSLNVQNTKQYIFCVTMFAEKYISQKVIHG